ncbi:transmembrane protein [methanogenic archaeon ISO4-H5]|nr:transmembrane protein [methanogenic archaeon ISO4-H5]
MKVIRIRIGSFGKLRDRSMEMSPGLNAVYGPNEAGKSTLRSFITTTLFPKSKVNYPTPKTSDSGSVDVILENGDNITFTKDGKKSNGMGSLLCGIDDKEYVSIYSMQPDELRDVDRLENGGIRNRFLTIPGGGDLPRAYEIINSERTALLPDGRRSPTCGIARLVDAENTAVRRVRELQNRESGDNRYSELVRRKSELTAQLQTAQKTFDTADKIRLDSNAFAHRAEDLQKLEKLIETEKSLAYSENTDPSRLEVLENEIKNRRDLFEASSRKEDACKTALDGRDCELYIRYKKKIEQIDRFSADYEFYCSSETTPAAVPVSSGGLPVLAIAGAGVAVAGIAVAAIVNVIAGGAVVAIGAIIALFGLRSRRSAPAPAPVRQENETAKRMENALDQVASVFDIPRRGYHADVRTLMDGLRASEAYQEAAKELKAAQDALDQATKAKELFLSGYNGEEGYRKAVADSKELISVRSQIEALRASTSNVPETPVDADTAESEYSTAHSNLTAIKEELSGINQALKDIGDDTSVEDALTASSDAADKVYDACFRWARLMMEKLILDKASEEAYGSHRPDVLQRADGFLMLMTGGRYSMSTDPRDTELAIVDRNNGEKKIAKEWSSGLEDQVKLSVKMAVSLSLSKEKPPVILDDILLTSDTERKRAACKALAELSRDIQVIYFTCDRETRDFLEAEGASVTEI